MHCTKCEITRLCRKGQHDYLCGGWEIPFCAGKDDVIIFVADGRFHLEVFMIANPELRGFRYDPYLGKLFLEEYECMIMRG